MRMIRTASYWPSTESARRYSSRYDDDYKNTRSIDRDHTFNSGVIILHKYITNKPDCGKNRDVVRNEVGSKLNTCQSRLANTPRWSRLLRVDNGTKDGRD